VRKDVRVYIEYIMESIDLIEQYVSGMSKADFLRSRQVQDSVIIRLETIGEATKDIPPYVQELQTDIPWRKMAGMRDVLAHDYFGVNLNLVWSVVKKELPSVRQYLLTLMEHLPDDSTGD